MTKTSLKGLLAAAAITLAGAAIAQSTPPNPAAKDPAVGAGQQSTQSTPMGATGTPNNAGGSSATMGASGSGSTSGSGTSGSGSTTGASNSGTMGSGTSGSGSTASGSASGGSSTMATDSSSGRTRADRN